MYVLFEGELKFFPFVIVTCSGVLAYDRFCSRERATETLSFFFLCV